MSTIGVVRDLSEVFLWIGFAGAGLAVLCALVVAIALAAGSAGVTGGAAAVWIGGGMLSLTAGFSGQWMPALLAGGALAAGLLLGGLLRPIVRRFERRPKSEATGVAPATATPRRVVAVRSIASESIR